MSKINLPFPKRGCFAAAALFLIMLPGCVQLQELRPLELRAPEFHSKTVQLNKSLSEILDILNWHKEHLRNVQYPYAMTAVPISNGFSLWWENTSLYHTGTVALMDFQQNTSNPHLVTVNIYAPKFSWGASANLPEYVLSLLQQKPF